MRLSPVETFPRGSLEAPAKCHILPYVSAGMSSPSPRWSIWRGRQMLRKPPPSKQKWPAISTRHHIIFRTVYLPHSISEFGRIVRHCAARSRLASARHKPSDQFLVRLRRNFWFGLRRLRWNSFCWAAFLANAATCSSVCRLASSVYIVKRLDLSSKKIQGARVPTPLAFDLNGVHNLGPAAGKFTEIGDVEDEQNGRLGRDDGR